MEEIWKDIQGYEDLYQISNLGCVKSLGNDKNRKEKILKPKKEKSGYLRVELHKNGGKKQMYIHRLVALHFILNDDLFKTQINHKDENKENNNVNNLEWCNAYYNSNYGTRNERSGKSRLNHPKWSKKVNQYSIDDGALIKTWESTMQIERETGFAQQNISKCCNGKRKTANGFIWKYKNEE